MHDLTSKSLDCHFFFMGILSLDMHMSFLVSAQEAWPPHLKQQSRPLHPATFYLARFFFFTPRAIPGKNHWNCWMNDIMSEKKSGFVTHNTNMHQNAKEAICLCSEAANLFLNVNSPGSRDRPFSLKKKKKRLGPTDAWVISLQQHLVLHLFLTIEMGG